jgi:hypothetical protein
MSISSDAGAIRAVTEIEELIINLQKEGYTSDVIVSKTLDLCRSIKSAANLGYY